MPRFLLFLLASGTLSAQALSFGLKVGAPLTDPNGNLRTSVPYAVGPSVEVRMSRRYAIEGSAILHHFRSTSLGPVTTLGTDLQITPTATTRIRGNSWEFPVLAKRYFRTQANRLEPYVGAGAALRTIGYRYDGAIQSISSGVSTLTPFQVQNRSGLGAGAAFEAGIRTRIGRVAFLPEVRYTHWADRRSGLNKEDAGVNLGFRF